MNIRKFKIGDKIVRTKPSEIVKDGSYIGEELTLKSIRNGNINLDMNENSIVAKIIGKTSVTLREFYFSNGWEYFENVNETL